MIGRIQEILKKTAIALLAVLLVGLLAVGFVYCLVYFFPFSSLFPTLLYPTSSSPSNTNIGWFDDLILSLDQIAWYSFPLWSKSEQERFRAAAIIVGLILFVALRVIWNSVIFFFNVFTKNNNDGRNEQQQ